MQQRPKGKKHNNEQVIHCGFCHSFHLEDLLSGLGAQSIASGNESLAKAEEREYLSKMNM